LCYDNDSFRVDIVPAFCADWHLREALVPV
jgi:hypothetical protein